MIKKCFVIIIVSLFIFLESCGTIIKYKYLKSPVTNKLDWTVVALDGIGVVLFFIPGVIAFSIDYMTGALFIPQGSFALQNYNPEDIQKILKNNNINIDITTLEKGKVLALNN